MELNNFYVLVTKEGIPYIISNEKELEKWKSDGSIETGSKLYKSATLDGIWLLLETKI